jgi:hypothetical protein
MSWDDVKRVYSSQWVLIEAIQARTENDKRIIEKMDVLEGFGEDGDRAFQKYIELHKLYKEREYYIYHTSHDSLDIGVKKWMGVRL